MKYTWRLTPQLWAIGETQAHYAKLAAKGWMLQKRGTRIDRFVRTEPQSLQFWLEFTKRDEDIPTEKVQLYEDCGWKLVSDAGNVHVFAAADSADVPQPYDIDDPQQDAMMRQLQRYYRNDILTFLITLPLLIAVIVASGFAPLHEVLTGWWWGMFWFFGLMGSVWVSLYGFFRMRRLRKHLRAGEWPRVTRLRGFNGVKNTLVGLSVLCLLIGFVELALSFNSRHPMPETSNGIYVVPSEVLDMPRTPAEESFYGKLDPQQANAVNVSYALPFFTLYEAQEVLGDDDLTTWQDVYVLNFPSLAPRLAQSLMENGVFADVEYYVPVEIEGLDAAWYVPTAMEYVAYKGEKVVYGIVNGEYETDYLIPMLEATATLWSE